MARGKRRIVGGHAHAGYLSYPFRLLVRTGKAKANGCTWHVVNITAQGNPTRSGNPWHIRRTVRTDRHCSSVRRRRTRAGTRYRHTHTHTSAPEHTQGTHTQGKPTRQATTRADTRHKPQGKEQKHKPIAKHKQTMLECIPSCSVTVETIPAKATRKPQAHTILQSARKLCYNANHARQQSQALELSTQGSDRGRTLGKNAYMVPDWDKPCI